MTSTGETLNIELCYYYCNPLLISNKYVIYNLVETGLDGNIPLSSGMALDNSW